METDTRRSPDCLKCVYFKVSWDPHFPRICTLFAIKTRHLPSIEVFQATGHQCPSFTPKGGLQ